MQNVFKKLWLPMAACIAILSLGFVLKTVGSSEKISNINGIIVDNQVTNHLWCSSSTLESACGACKKANRPQRPVKRTLLSSLVDSHSLRVEPYRIKG
jgi:hypothetical protein